MSYFQNRLDGLAGFGCGPGCGCQSCKAGSHELGQTYEPDDLEGLGTALALWGGQVPSRPWGRASAFGNSEHRGFAQAPAPAPPACDIRGIPQDRPAVQFTANRVACTPPVFGQADPIGVVERAVRRAVQMLDRTIEELEDARNSVCGGHTPAGVVREITACWLRNCLSISIDDARVWTAHSFVNRSVAEIIRRLVRVRNLIASNAIRYVCGGSGICGPCDPGVWAFVCRVDSAGNPLPVDAAGRLQCEGKTRQTIIHLCQPFWVPGRDPNGNPVPAGVQAEFQAQTIIHETSHLYHCTRDDPSVTIGGAECLAQFVAATNDSPLDPNFADQCCRPRCDNLGAVSGAGLGGFGAVTPGSRSLQMTTTFRPWNAKRSAAPRARVANSRRTPAPRLGGPLGQPNEPPGPKPVPVLPPSPAQVNAAWTQYQGALGDIITQLNRNFQADDVAGLHDRLIKLTDAFNKVPPLFASNLIQRLGDRNDSLSKLFHYKIHHVTRSTMMNILLNKVSSGPV